MIIYELYDPCCSEQIGLFLKIEHAEAAAAIYNTKYQRRPGEEIVIRPTEVINDYQWSEYITKLRNE